MDSSSATQGSGRRPEPAPHRPVAVPPPGHSRGGGTNAYARDSRGGGSVVSQNGDGRDAQDREAALALALLDRNAAIRQIVNGVVSTLDVPIAYAAVVVDDLDTMQIVATNGTWGLTDLIIPSGR